MRLSSTTFVALMLLALPAYGADVPAGQAEPKPAPVLCEIEEKIDIPYVNDNDERHLLDVYVPKGKKDFPVLLLVHGGAWVTGSKETFLGLMSYADVGKGLARQGIGVVMPNYRLSPAIKHPEHVTDVARAFAWTHKNIAKHGGRVDQLFLGGHSAGGHLVSLLATDETYLKNEKLCRKDIKGVISISGVYRLTELDFSVVMNGQLGLKGNAKFDPFILAFGDDPKVRKQAAPLTHVQEGLPPFLIVYATPLDLPTLPEMAREFAAALKEKNCSVELCPAVNRTHGTVMFNAKNPTDPVAAQVVKFITKQTAEKPEGK